jgi:hypothetical protein
MRSIIIFLLLFFLCSVASAEQPWIAKSEALAAMKGYLEDHDYITILGKDTLAENNIILAYPYGYGPPKYVGYFMIRTHNITNIIAISIDAMSGNLLSRGVEKGSELYPDMVADSNSYYETTMRFLDSSFVKNEIEMTTEQSVHMMQFMSCGGVYRYLDCLNIAPYFWVVHFDNGEDYIFYYTIPDNWILVSNNQEKQKVFNSF